MSRFSKNYPNVPSISHASQYGMSPKRLLIYPFAYQRALPMAVLHFKLYLGQTWDIAQLYALPTGIAWIKEQDVYRKRPAEAHITLGVYRAELIYSFQAGKFMVTRIIEVRDPMLREELWKIAGRSFKRVTGALFSAASEIPTPQAVQHELVREHDQE